MKHTVVIHANCQGDMLAHILGQHPPFAERCECRLFTNYAKEHVPPELLQRCDVFLYQYLPESWGELASEKLLAHVRRHCRAIAVPNMFLRLYWPLHRGGSRPHELRDQLLDDLLERGVGPQELALLARSPAMLRRYDLQGIVDKSLEHERNKESKADIPHVERMLELSRSQHAFYSVNHPGAELLYYVADEVLQRLDIPLLDRENPPGLDDYYTALELPINPAVAQEFGLDFVDEKTTFNVYGLSMTYAQFVAVYAQYRGSGAAGLVDFLAHKGQDAGFTAPPA